MSRGDEAAQPEDPIHHIEGALSVHRMNWSSNWSTMRIYEVEAHRIELDTEMHAALMTYTCGHCHAYGETQPLGHDVCTVHHNAELSGLANTVFANHNMGTVY